MNQEPQAGGQGPPEVPSTAAPPRRRRVTVPWVVGIVTVLVVVTAGIAVALDDDDTTTLVPQVRGAEIGNADAALRRAETDVVGLATDRDATVGNELRCWFSYPSGAGDPGRALRCGPIYFVDSQEGAFWIDVPVSFTVRDGSATAHVEEDIEPVTHTLESEEQLIRPDGEEPPGPDDVQLDRPPPPAADAGTVEVTDQPPSLELTEQPGDGRLYGASYRVDVDGFAYTDRVTLPDGDTYSPAPGERWLVARLTVDDPPDSVEVDAAGTAQVSLEVDGRRLDVSEVVEGRTSGSATEGRTLIASVPDDAGDISLVGTETSLEQSWSFTDDARSDTAPEVLYRDDQRRRTDLNQQRTLPYGVSDSEPSVIDAAFGDVEATVTVPTASLRYMVMDGDSRTHTAAGPDRALLHLPDSAVSLGEYEHRISHVARPATMVVTLPDGTDIEATRLSEDDHTNLFGGVVVWDVPADVREATVTLTPGRGPDPDNPSRTVDFRDGSVSFDIDFGPP